MTFITPNNVSLAEYNHALTQLERLPGVIERLEGSEEALLARPDLVASNRKAINFLRHMLRVHELTLAAFEAAAAK